MSKSKSKSNSPDSPGSPSSPIFTAYAKELWVKLFPENHNHVHQAQFIAGFDAWNNCEDRKWRGKHGPEAHNEFLKANKRYWELGYDEGVKASAERVLDRLEERFPGVKFRKEVEG